MIARAEGGQLQAPVGQHLLWVSRSFMLPPISSYAH